MVKKTKYCESYKKSKGDIMIKIQLILDYMKEHHLSKAKFSKLCKMRTQTLNNILNGKNFNLRFLFKIAWAMNLNIWQLVE